MWPTLRRRRARCGSASARRRPTRGRGDRGRQPRAGRRGLARPGGVAGPGVDRALDDRRPGRRVAGGVPADDDAPLHGQHCTRTYVRSVAVVVELLDIGADELPHAQPGVQQQGNNRRSTGGLGAGVGGGEQRLGLRTRQAGGARRVGSVFGFCLGKATLLDRSRLLRPTVGQDEPRDSGLVWLQVSYISVDDPPAGRCWSGGRGEGEQAASVRLGVPDSAGHGAADGVGVSDLEDAVVRHRGERDRSHAPFEGLGLAAVQP